MVHAATPISRILDIFEHMVHACHSISLESGYLRTHGACPSFHVSLEFWISSNTMKVLPVIELSIRKIHERNLLPGWIFSVFPVDTECDAAFGTWAAIKSYIENPVHLFLGPFCDYITAPVARLAKFFQIPLLTPAALADDFTNYDKRSNTSEYHMLVKPGWSFSDMARALEKVFYRFGWHKLMFVYDMNGRPEMAKEDYCMLAIKALYETFFSKTNCTINQKKLKQGMSYEHLLRHEVGVDYGTSNKSRLPS
ncbi:Atrial natriuretic peptide receptor 1 like protein [Argiope bruennichi]|uniref:Atrial natriuretic peptide receptor 1 like protein n=1 Tax=Argiope bruennichi TaxID=94029 RepID=A0A8T0FFI9_ARGBR|nr:Atrial natriuretic peptide receptor 1 like protein [Argiope bruennichi]